MPLEKSQNTLMQEMDKKCMYSVVLPVYNEDGNVEKLIGEIASVMASMRTSSFEIVVVDDCSMDGSRKKLLDMAAQHSFLRIGLHTQNFGQSASMASGFRMARGGIVITLDADGQNDPADIPLLLAALGDGVDAVCGVRQRRKDSWVKLASSRLGNAFRNVVTGDRVMDAGCGMRVIRRSALLDVPVFNGMHRFLPTLLRSQGYRVLEVPVCHRARTWGHSKYGIGNRAWRGMLDCIAIRWWMKRALPGRRLRD